MRSFSSGTRLFKARADILEISFDTVASRYDSSLTPNPLVGVPPRPKRVAPGGGEPNRPGANAFTGSETARLAGVGSPGFKIRLAPSSGAHPWTYTPSIEFAAPPTRARSPRGNPGRPGWPEGRG